MGERSFSLVSVLPLLAEISFICAEGLQLNHRWGMLKHAGEQCKWQYKQRNYFSYEQLSVYKK